MEIIVKTTDACNGNCVYCSADGAEDRRARLRPEQIRPMLRALASWLAGDDERNLRFIWHGGEPMLLGLGFYRELLAAEQEILGRERWRAKHSMQSNLSLLTDEWVSLLQQLVRHETIGTSFDIVPGVRGLRGGEDLTDRWLRSVEMLKSAGLRVGVVYVVHRKSLGRAHEIYRFFRNVLPTAGVRYNPIYAEGRAASLDARPLQIMAQEYGRFLVELADAWHADGYRGRVFPLSEWRGAWQGHSGGLCCDSAGRCAATHLSIGPDGTVFGCGRAADHGFEPFGSIFEQSVDELLARRAALQRAGRAELLQRGPCGDCPYWRLCHGGCPVLSQLYAGDPNTPDPFCEARKILLQRFEERFGPITALPPAPAPPPEEERDALGVL